MSVLENARHSGAGEPGKTGASGASAAPERPPQARRVPLAVGAVLAVALGGSTAVVGGWRMAVLYAIGLAFGIVLFHARFGFTSAWRQLVAVGQGRALRAHMLMLAVACALFAPLLAAGVGVGVDPEGYVSPLGVSVVVGAFLFGLGMQIGGSCASGTLYNVGGGQTAIVFTLVGFIVGSVLGAWNFAFWTSTMPSGPAISLARTPLGYGGALAVSLAVLGLIAAVTRIVARRRQPPEVGRPPAVQGFARIVRGSWPLWVGAIALAGLNALTLVFKGSPWGITSAFALWGSKAAQGLGVDVSSWPYWSTPGNAETLANPVLAHATSVMDLGIILGALVAAAAGGSFVLHRRVPPKIMLGAIVGGILMGYGARIAYGCNIGAYFGGIASFSLHGWLWAIVAIAGTYAGLKARPLFGLAVPKPGDSSC
ncbi:YeeE/YedE family protein [Haloactinomyces albus]|uniref:Membrane protein YedE/YeeE n=1 Tax=Haloactinomyces albus TaxID=1352928 RepID=A0AAE3ZCI7_9ACTN|nr:YeeE/YedE family protein [Haloactinomyces albus]MDR7302418.1 putative membrane protein YedE/YeeE [Haloactinomyces albus]